MLSEWPRMVSGLVFGETGGAYESRYITPSGAVMVNGRGVAACAHTKTRPAIYHGKPPRSFDHPLAYDCGDHAIPLN